MNAGRSNTPENNSLRLFHIDGSYLGEYQNAEELSVALGLGENEIRYAIETGTTLGRQYYIFETINSNSNQTKTQTT